MHTKSNFSGFFFFNIFKLALYKDNTHLILQGMYSNKSCNYLPFLFFFDTEREFLLDSLVAMHTHVGTSEWWIPR